MKRKLPKKDASTIQQGVIFCVSVIVIILCMMGIGKLLKQRGIPEAVPATPAEALPVQTEGPKVQESQESVPSDEQTETHENADAEHTPQYPVQTQIIWPSNPLEAEIHASQKVDLVQKASSTIKGEDIALPMTGLVIGIDPGHQEKANSAHEPVAPGSKQTKPKVASGTQGIASGVPEYETNLQISLLLRDALEKLGAQVIMTRTKNDVDISNIERAQMCNQAQADLVLRLHCNGSTNKETHGIGLYVGVSTEVAQSSYVMAEILLDAMTAETGAKGNGVYRRDSYSGLNWSEVPSILVEMGYMTNPEEDRNLQDPLYQEKLVTGMIKGLATCFSREMDESEGTLMKAEKSSMY